MCICVYTNTHACLDGQTYAQVIKNNSFNKVFTPYLKQVFMKKNALYPD